MPLSWDETWEEQCRNALALYIATDRQPTVEDLKAIRSRLRTAVVQLDRLIAAGPLRVAT